jgi:hypothetical protein
MENILIATLGESPSVITATHQLLTERARVPLKRVVVLFPTEELIRSVYHTLITDAALSARVEEETSVTALRPTAVNRATRNDRLFLRAYADGEPEARFTLFRVPVLPARKENSSWLS